MDTDNDDDDDDELYTLIFVFSIVFPKIAKNN